MNTVNRPEKKTKGQRASKLTHEELMNKRHQKKKKKEKKNNHQRKKELIAEYLTLNDTEVSSNKDTARVIMEVVEEIKDEGMNDKRYLDIMDQLMSLHRSEESRQGNVYYNYIDLTEDNQYNDLTDDNQYNMNFINRRIDTIIDPPTIRQNTNILNLFIDENQIINY
tara:strand:- start:431 stop:931 length:501 start_codon:yes stop_codon:yes gene_type:complete